MAGYFANGTIFSATISSVLTPIAELTTITGLQLEADDVDVSSHDSTNKYREYVQGLKDAGEVELEGNFMNDSSQSGLKDLFDSGDVVAMTISFPSSAGLWSFTGYVKGFTNDAPFDDKISFTATIKVTGQPTLTSNASI
jgi:predicted secreted protein